MAKTTTPESVAQYLADSSQTEVARCLAADVVLPATAASLRDPRIDDPSGIEELTTFGLIELMLKDQPRLDQLSRTPAMQRELIPRLLAVALVGYAVFGIALAIVFNSARVWPELTSLPDWLKSNGQPLIRFAAEVSPNVWGRWIDGSALSLIAAFTLGMIGAIGVCLPTFYFYGLLAGVRTSMLQVATSALKGMASSAVALVGALPIYFAVVLGLLVFEVTEGLVSAVCILGLHLPFIAGFYGTRSLYISFVGLTDTLPADRRCRRGCFLRRLLLAWSACFTAVTPVMIFTLWEYMSS